MERQEKSTRQGLQENAKTYHNQNLPKIVLKYKLLLQLFYVPKEWILIYQNISPIPKVDLSGIWMFTIIVAQLPLKK